MFIQPKEGERNNGLVFRNGAGKRPNPDPTCVSPVSLVGRDTSALRSTAGNRRDGGAAIDASSMITANSNGQDGAASGLKTAQSRLASRRFSLFMIRSRQELALSDDAYWFCLRTQPKHEHVAAAMLRREFSIPCFSPRLRFRKATRRGAVWFVEPMFPGYIFAEYIYPLMHRRVEYASGVQGVVHFGDYLATIDAATVALLQEKAGDDEIVTIDPEIKAGQSVRIAEGPFQGIEAVVTRLVPARERVKVLLEFLGRPVETEVSLPRVVASQPRTMP